MNNYNVQKQDLNVATNELNIIEACNIATTSHEIRIGKKHLPQKGKHILTSQTVSMHWIKYQKLSLVISCSRRYFGLT